MTCGIYMIHNISNNKFYIGQAVNIEKRWNNHKNELNNNKHVNKHLQNAWNKYKEENFKFSIICKCKEEQLNTLEEYYIFELMTYDYKIGYNKQYGGQSNRPTEETKKKIGKANKEKYSKINNYMYGKHHTEETKKKIKENHADFKGKNHPMYGKHHSIETRRKMSEAATGFKNHESRAVICIETKRIFCCIREAEKVLGINHSNISRCCLGKQKTAGRFHWAYYEEADK